MTHTASHDEHRAAARRGAATLIAGFALSAAFALLAAPWASAATPAPGWTIRSVAEPTFFSSADIEECGCTEIGELGDRYRITATNAGAAPTDGSPVTISDTLPPGLTAQAASLKYISGVNGREARPVGGCTTAPLRCIVEAPLPAGATLLMEVHVHVDPGASGEATNLAQIEGGGAPSASTALTNRLNEGDALFGLAGLGVDLAGEDGQPDLRAGAHPRSLTTSFDFRTKALRRSGKPTLAIASEQVKHLLVDLPLGFLGDPLAAARCPLNALTVAEESGGGFNNFCPPTSQLGLLRASFTATSAPSNDPLMNLVPDGGHPAALGAVVTLDPQVLHGDLVPSPAGYVLRTSTIVPETTFFGDVISVAATLYGNPAAIYNPGGPEVPFLTNPADCSLSGTTTTVHLDSWQHPGSFNPDGSPNLSDPNWKTQSVTLPPVTGCSRLEFTPAIEARPTTNVADSPSGLDVTVKVPQNQDPKGLATPPLKKAVIALPQGIAVNPSAANGLEGCTLAQLGMSPGGVPDAAPAQCPDASKIGSVKLKTPLLEKELEGAVYVAKPFENPFGSLLALYLVVDDPETGVVVKLPGKVTSDPNTGQLTTVFDNNPQLPFEELKVHLFAGAKAALRTPSTCGSFATTSTLTPWSAPESGPPATPGDSFQIAAGPGGSSCPQTEAEEPNSPGFEAGTVAPIAGAFSPFVVHLSRPDGSQNLAGLNLTLPPGLTGRLAGIPHCPDSALAAAREKSGAAEQATPSCPLASRLGTVTVAAGAGPSPYYVQGKAYLAGPYKGAPFSVAIITPAVAGPFDLGTVVVRAALYVNPETAQITVKSDPIPTILDGIPLDLRSISVEMDRNEFTLNPTSCDPMAVTGQALSVLGQAASLSSRFQVGGCGELPFRPSFTVSTQGKTGKANGASLTVKLAQKPGEANIHKVKLQLPLALPSRLTTLQKACTEAQFNANPAACPEGSNIGTATAVTPVLNVPLTGPAYLVSHGGAAFPDVEFVLQGEGVEIVLDGKTSIKKGITYSNFETVPDAPISSFETVLPEGPHSALAANGNLCATTKTVSVRKRVTVRVHGHTKRVTKTLKQTVAQPLLMPTTLVGQNGAVVHQTTKIAVTGCAKAKNARRAKRTSRHRKGKHNKH
jgi:uncharacterized repeat protein (TIGR01451 family)